MNANPWRNVFSRLRNSPVSQNPDVTRYNPRPRGVIRPVSATRAALDFFKINPNRFFSRWALIQNTGCTAKSIDWACRYLIAQGLIEAAFCDPRSPRYNQYRLVNGCKHEAPVTGSELKVRPEVTARDVLPFQKSKFQRYCALRLCVNHVGTDVSGEVVPIVADHATAAVPESLSGSIGRDDFMLALHLTPDSADVTAESSNLVPPGQSVCSKDEGTQSPVDRHQKIPT